MNKIIDQEDINNGIISIRAISKPFWPDWKTGLKNIGIWVILLTILVLIIFFNRATANEELLVSGLTNELISVKSGPSYKELIHFRDSVASHVGDYVRATSDYDREGNCSGPGCEFEDFDYWENN